MRLGWLGAFAIPVESHRRDEIVLRLPAPAPDIELRWGRPSCFLYSQARVEDRVSPGVTIELPDDEPAHRMRIIPATLQVRSEQVEATADDGSTIRIDRLTRMGFHFTELLPTPTPAWPQPARTTWFDLSFALHPETDKEA